MKLFSGWVFFSFFSGCIQIFPPCSLIKSHIFWLIKHTDIFPVEIQIRPVLSSRPPPPPTYPQLPAAPPPCRPRFGCEGYQTFWWLNCGLGQWSKPTNLGNIYSTYFKHGWKLFPEIDRVSITVRQSMAWIIWKILHEFASLLGWELKGGMNDVGTRNPPRNIDSPEVFDTFTKHRRSPSVISFLDQRCSGPRIVARPNSTPTEPGEDIHLTCRWWNLQ